MLIQFTDLKQEIQVYTTNHPGDKDKTFRLDSNKLQVELETSSCNSSPLPPGVTVTPTNKSKRNSLTKRLFSRIYNADSVKKNKKTDKSA